MKPAALAVVIVLAWTPPLAAQAVSLRGFVEARAFWFPQDAMLDRQNLILDVAAREELFLRPKPWLQIQAGVDIRGNTGDQVGDSWMPEIADRGSKRPIVAIRRLAATVARGPLTLDVGKQFVRWGKTDIVTPTDRFAPRDYLNVVDNDFLAVRAVRAVVQLADHSIDAVWVPVFTPSRLPLAGKRWTVIPSDLPAVESIERNIPTGAQAGIRWGYTASGYELSLSLYDGFNHLPVVEPAGPLAFAIIFPALRMYGADVALPTRWVTVKGEAAYFTSSSRSADEYVLYVVQLERQQGEWLFIAGYAGERVTVRRAVAPFAPDRGMTHSLIGRASYTIGPTRSVAVETAVRETLDGVYVEGEYSQAHGDRWRATVTLAVVGGEPDDFLGQYRRNSHAILALRYSF